MKYKALRRYLCCQQLCLVESLHVHSLDIMVGEVVSMHLKKFINKLVELTSALSNEQILDLVSREIVVKLTNSKMKEY